MSEFQQNKVSQAVWPWTREEEPPKKGLPRQVRALIQVAIMGLIILLLRHWEHVLMVKIVSTLAVVVLVSGLFIPPVFHKIEQFGQWLGRAVSVGLTWGLLTPFYYITFVPGRLVHLLLGKDPMHRKCPSDEPSYWIPRPPVRSLEQYKKQH